MRKLPVKMQTALQDKKAIAHDSAIKHVSGQSIYVDDILEWPNQLHIATGYSAHAHAKLTKVDLHKVRTAPGVVDVIVQEDIPGNADISPVFTGDLLLAGDSVSYIGQPIFAVAATSLDAAKRAVKLAQIEYEVLPPLLDLDQSVAHEDFVLPTHTITMGDADKEAETADVTLTRTQTIRGQEHMYLEGQISIAYPMEDGGMKIHASSQHPAEVQKLVASVLGVPVHIVQTSVKRMGGGFGGKESQAVALACMAAVFAHRNQCPVKYRMPRQDDMIQTGKRHDFWNQYSVSFNRDGMIKAVKMDLAGKCGFSADLSDGIVDRAMYHADNAYFLNSAIINGYRCRTNTVSNTAFRGFGGPKGVLTAESMIDDIARYLHVDPLDIRKRNLYQGDRNTTPYGQPVTEGVLVDLIDQLEETSDYRVRREAIMEFNRENTWLKKGLALTPVKFGVSFTTQHLNQGGALVHIYTDGSVFVSHGGTEMGQGLNTKIAQVAARALGVNLERIHVGETSTDKVPNASPTAASAGTDLNGMATINAIEKILAGLYEFASQHYHVPLDQIQIRDDQLWLGENAEDFGEFIKLAYLHRTPLSATGFYKTPKIFYDRKKAQGKPFFYFANGAACSEVLVDTLTGEYKVTQVDILHDVGDSLNPAIDIGQIEGGFVQGMGWLTTEELLWDENGRIISNSPANYKIPTASDIPECFNVALFDRPNQENNVYYSKAVGEPPLMLPISVWCALRDACASLADYQFNPPLNAPATPEQVYYAIQAAKSFVEEQAAV